MDGTCVSISTGSVSDRLSDIDFLATMFLDFCNDIGRRCNDVRLHSSTMGSSSCDIPCYGNQSPSRIFVIPPHCLQSPMKSPAVLPHRQAFASASRAVRPNNISNRSRESFFTTKPLTSKHANSRSLDRERSSERVLTVNKMYYFRQ